MKLSFFLDSGVKHIVESVWCLTLEFIFTGVDRRGKRILLRGLPLREQDYEWQKVDSIHLLLITNLLSFRSLPTSLTLTSIPANQSGSELNRPKTGHLKKNNLSNYRRGSSDGVERHFEEINGNSSPKVTSKSDDSIINSFSSVCDEENYKIKYAEFDVHETQSSSSESASHPPSHGLKSKSFDLNSSQNSPSKKRGLFGLRKRKSKIDK